MTTQGSPDQVFNEIDDMERVGGVRAEILPGLQVIEVRDGDLYSVRLDMYEARALCDWLNRALPCECCTPQRKCPDHGACVTDGEI